MDIAIDNISNPKTYKMCKNTHAFRILTGNLYKHVLTCKIIDNSRAKRFAQRTEEEIRFSYSYSRQSSLRQVDLQSDQYRRRTLWKSFYNKKQQSDNICHDLIQIHIFAIRK